MQIKFNLSILQDVDPSAQEDHFKGTVKLLYDLLILFRIPSNII
jgi:hypothetical protein